MGLTNLIDAFRIIGLRPPSVASHDIGIEAIQAKITNPVIAKSMKAERSISLIQKTELCANLLDSFSESGDWNFVFKAQQIYAEILNELPDNTRTLIETAVASAFNYFSYEELVVKRVQRKDSFMFLEIAEYLLRRGSDAIIYALLLSELDHINDTTITMGFRIRQALWDMADDLRDLESDRQSTGANLFLLGGLKQKDIRRLANQLYREGMNSVTNKPLKNAIAQEYEVIHALL